MAARSLLVITVVGLAVLGSLEAHAGPATGSVTGVVFDDYDGDGLRGKGEPGIPDKEVFLSQPGQFLRRVTTNAGGSYRVGGLAPGEYELSVVLDRSVGLCVLLDDSFSPLERSWCAGFTFPWTTVPEAVTMTVAAGTTMEVDVGAQAADVALITGDALLDADYAPVGTVIEAFVGDQACGATEVAGGLPFNFTMQVHGERSREGCAAIGDIVRFVVGGVPAAEPFTYVPFAQVSRPGFHIHHLVAMERHAWYWSGPLARTGTNDAVEIKALIDGVVCGATWTHRSRFGPGAMVGFDRLIVPSEEVTPGCGRPGAEVSFRAGGLASTTSIPWRPGLQELELTFVGDVDCDLTGTAIDAALLLQSEAGLLADVPCGAGADVNGDGAVDSRDAALVLQYVAGFIDSLG